MTVATAADVGDEVRIAISTDYLAAVQVRQVQPEPQHVELAANELVYVFPIAERGDHSPSPSKSSRGATGFIAGA